MLCRHTMLLLLICLFFHYDFLHCVKEKENLNDGFLDYSITEFWWNGTPGIDQTDRITPQYSFMPTPYGHGKFVGDDGVVYDVQADSPPEPTVSSEEIKTFTAFPNMTRVSFPFSVDTVVGPSLPPRPPTLPSPWHINYPGLTPPPNFPSDYRYPTVFPTMYDPMEYSPSPTGPTPRRPSFTLPSVSRPKLTYPTLFTTSTLLPPETWPSGGRVTTTPEPETSPVSWDPAAAYIKMWKEKLASNAADGTTPLDMMPKLRGIFNYDYTTSAEELPLAPRRVSSMSGRELKKSQKVTVDAMAARKDPGYEFKAPSYDPYNLAEEAIKQKRTKYTHTLTAATTPTQGTELLIESMATTEAENTNDDDDIKETRQGNDTYTHSSAPIPLRDNKRSVNLALETVLEFKEKDKASDITFLDNVQNFITKVKTVIGKNSNVKTGFRRDFKAPAVDTFTGFIQEVTNILNTYDNTTFTEFFENLDKEIRKYHYRGCKFYELTENNEIRKFIAAKLDLMRRTPGSVMKTNINTFSGTLKKLNNKKNVREIFDYINSLYRQDARSKFQKVLAQLELHGKSNSKSNSRLGEIIKNGVRSIIFDHYTNLNTNVRRDVKQKMETFWKQFNENPPSMSNIPNNKTSGKIMNEEKNAKPVSRKQTTNVEVKPFVHKNVGTKRDDVKHDNKQRKNTRKDTIDRPFKVHEKGKRVPSPQRTDATVQQGTKIEYQESSNSFSSDSLEFYHQPKEDKRQDKAINSERISKKTLNNSRKKSEKIVAVNPTRRNPIHKTVSNIWIEESTGRLPKEVLDKLSNKARGHNTAKAVAKRAPENNKKFNKGRKSWHGKMYESKHDTKRITKHRSTYDSQYDSRQGPRQKPNENKILKSDERSKRFNMKLHQYKKSMGPMKAELYKTDRSSPDATKTLKFLDVLDVLKINAKSGKAIKNRQDVATKKLAAPLRTKRVKYDAARRMKVTRRTLTDLGPQKQLSKINKTLSWKSGTQFVKSLEHPSSSSEGLTVEQMEIKNDKAPKTESEQKVTSLEKDLYVIRKIKNLEKEIEEVKSRINDKVEVKLGKPTEKKEKWRPVTKTGSDVNNDHKIDKLETAETVDNKTKLININKDIEEVASKYNDVNANRENGTINNADVVKVKELQRSTESNKLKRKLTKAKPRPLVNRSIIDTIPRNDKLEITGTAHNKSVPVIDNTYVQNLVSKYKKLMEGFEKGKSKMNVNNEVDKVKETFSDYAVTGTAKTTKEVLTVKDKDLKNIVEGKKPDTFFRSDINITNEFMERNENAKATRIADYQKDIIEKDKDSKNSETKFHINEVKSRPKTKQINYFESRDGFLNITKTKNHRKEILNKSVSVSDFKSIDKDKMPETIFRSDVNLITNDFKDKTEIEKVTGIADKKYKNYKNDKIMGNVEKLKSRSNADDVKERELQQSIDPNKIKRKLAKAKPRPLVESITMPGLERKKVPGSEDKTEFKVKNDYAQNIASNFDKLMAKIEKKSESNKNMNIIRESKVEHTYEPKENKEPIRKLVSIPAIDTERMFTNFEQTTNKLFNMTIKKSNKSLKGSEFKTNVNNINQRVKSDTSFRSDVNETPSDVQEAEKTKLIETSDKKMAIVEKDNISNSKEQHKRNIVGNDYQTIAETKEQLPIMKEDMKTLNIGGVTLEAKHGGTEMMKYRDADDASTGTEAEVREIESTSTSTKATESNTSVAMTAVATPTTSELSTLEVFLPSQSPFA